jgi:hypothetical protein
MVTLDTNAKAHGYESSDANRISANLRAAQGVVILLPPFVVMSSLRGGVVSKGTGHQSRYMVGQGGAKPVASAAQPV